jgi:rhamnosyltransferase
MSTYNGEKFLLEQIDSIFTQKTNAEISLYVRDDGSNDRTIEILEKYKKQNNVDIEIYQGANAGPADSFLDAIRKCPIADYYAFCDQDDVWEDNKLSVALDEIGEDEKPCLWISNYAVVNTDLQIIIPKAITTPCTDDLRVIFYNNVPGCVMVFNRQLLYALRKMDIDAIRMHDIMALNIALICGKVKFHQESLIKYRQHGNNAVGFSHKKTNIFKWIKQKLHLLVHKEKYSTAKYALQILDKFSEYLTDEQIKEYSLIAKAEISLKARIILLHKHYTKQKFGRTSLSIRCKILFGLML